MDGCMFTGYTNMGVCVCVEMCTCATSVGVGKLDTLGVTSLFIQCIYIYRHQKSFKQDTKPCVHQ